MKELYISPELEILCFAPVENLASVTIPTFEGGNSGGVSTGEVTNDHDYTITPSEGIND